jgi:hypothetical protein
MIRHAETRIEIRNNSKKKLFYCLIMLIYDLIFRLLFDYVDETVISDSSSIGLLSYFSSLANKSLHSNSAISVDLL